MCEPVTIGIIGAAAIGATAGAVINNQNRIAAQKQADKSLDQARESSKRAEDMANADVQKSKQPKDAADVLYGTSGDSGSTTLTGPQGVQKGSMTLGGSSLLGT